MSRCFAFPPPGYEGKFKSTDPDLLKKEKHREKKHKKEKRDKEKKESKERRDKERSDERHREKKDKKEKHREKKKDKERDRDKDKHKRDSLGTDEKRTFGPHEVHVLKPSEKSEDSEIDRSATSAEKRVSGQSTFCNGGPVIKNNHLAPESKSSKYASESGRRNTDEERRTINRFPDKNFAKERQKDEGVVKIAEKGAVPLVAGKAASKENPAADRRTDAFCVTGEARSSGNTPGPNSVGVVRLSGKNAGPLGDGRERKDKPAIDGRLDGRSFSGEARFSGGALPPNSVGMVQNRIGAMVRPMENNFEQKVQEKEKIREKDDDHRKGVKRKEKDREKSSRKDKEKEKKKEDKVKATSEHIHKEMNRIKDGSETRMLTPISIDGSKKDISGSQSIGIQNIPNNSNHASLNNNNNIRKRKDMGLNGIYDEHMAGPNKLARITSTHPLTENGRSSEPCKNSDGPGSQCPPMNIKVDRTFAPDDTQRPPMSIKVESKEPKINGIRPQPPTHSFQTTAKAERKSDVSAKPPHPDTKYLSQVLSVPKMDEWPECDDQEWLFSSSTQLRKVEGESSGFDDALEVWARAVRLEPVDVYALPYVIPH